MARLEELPTLEGEIERQRIEIETLRRQFAIAKRQWDNWKAEAMRLNGRLQKYEPGSPMLLNSAVPNDQLQPGSGSGRSPL